MRVQYLLVTLAMAALALDPIAARSHSTAGSAGGDSSTGGPDAPVTTEPPTDPPTTKPSTTVPSTTATPVETSTTAPVTTVPTTTVPTDLLSNLTVNSTLLSKVNKTSISTAVKSVDAVDEALDVATVAVPKEVSDSVYGSKKSSSGSKDSSTKTKATSGSLGGMMTIVGILACAAIVGIASVVIIRKRRDEDDDDDDTWDMPHVEPKSTVATQPRSYNTPKDTMDKRMVERRPSAPYNAQPMNVQPPQQQYDQQYNPQYEQQQYDQYDTESMPPSYPMEFRDTESAQYAMPQQNYTGTMEFNESICESADGFLDDRESEKVTAHQAAERYLAKQQTADDFLMQNSQSENDIEGDSERESELPYGVVDIDEPTPSENGRGSEPEMYVVEQPMSLDEEGSLAIDEENEPSHLLGSSVESGLSSIGDDFMAKTAGYNGDMMSRASENVQEGLEFDMPIEHEPSTGSTYCDRSSFGVFSVRDCSFDSENGAAQDSRYSQDSTFSVGTDVDIDDNDTTNTNGPSRFTELDEEFEV